VYVITGSFIIILKHEKMTRMKQKHGHKKQNKNTNKENKQTPKSSLNVYSSH
jgi:hypothetical protein